MKAVPCASHGPALLVAGCLLHMSLASKAVGACRVGIVQWVCILKSVLPLFRIFLQYDYILYL